MVHLCSYYQQTYGFIYCKQLAYWHWHSLLAFRFQLNSSSATLKVTGANVFTSITVVLTGALAIRSFLFGLPPSVDINRYIYTKQFQHEHVNFGNKTYMCTLVHVHMCAAVYMKLYEWAHLYTHYTTHCVYTHMGTLTCTPHTLTSTCTPHTPHPHTHHTHAHPHTHVHIHIPHRLETM